jgi:hypothetical protein
MGGRAGSGRAAHGKEDPDSLLCDRPYQKLEVFPYGLAAFSFGRSGYEQIQFYG